MPQHPVFKIPNIRYNKTTIPWQTMTILTMTSNVTKYIRYPRTVLIFFGLWPAEDRSILTEIYSVFIILEQYLFLMLNGFYIFMIRGDLQAMSDASHIFFTQLALCCRATSFSVNRKSLKKVLVMMDDDVFKPECDVHEKITKKYTYKCRILYTFLILGFLAVVTEWIVMTLVNNEERKYPYNEIWFPVDTEKSPQYELAYIYEIMALFSSAFIFLSVDTVSVTTMLFSCAQLDILKEKNKMIKALPWILKMSHKERREQLENNNKLLINCIKHHQAVNRFVKQIEETFHFGVFFQLCTTVLVICISGFRLARDSPTNASFYSNLNYFTLMLFQLYMYCWCGSELTEKSLEFRDWLYQMPWYEQDSKFNKTLWIVLECTKKPLVFRAGHYLPLARTTFISVLRCSYSYFAVLQQGNE